MNPLFCPSNGQLDVSRLVLAADGVALSPAFVNTIMTGIQAWAPLLGVSIVNLNLTRAAAANDYIIYVGNGTGTQAREPNNTLRVSYVTPTEGYLFITDPPWAISHEFGHLLGLADRYYEGYQHTPSVAGQRISVPMDNIHFPAEGDYNPATNLMSNPGTSWSLTNAQRQSILACTEETQLPRNVVGLFDTTGSQGASWLLPPTMYLMGDDLWTPDPPPPDLPIAGYTLFGGMVFKAKAGTTAGGNGPVRDLWCLRSRVDTSGQPAIRITWFRRGKKYRSRRTVANGPRIHRQMMRLIGKLAAS